MSKQHNIIVIVGLSGVGKSHVISELKKDECLFIHFSAGSLINKRRKLIERDKLRTLKRNDVLQNQYLLIDQFNNELESIPAGSIILFDAHMIIDSDDSILEIPFDIFKKINPSTFILLYDDPAVILSRRKKDSSRVRPRRSIDEIDRQQNKSQKLVEEYASRLSVPLIKLKPNDTEAIKNQCGQSN